MPDERWIPVTRNGGPAGYVVVDDAAPRAWRWRRVDHALPAVVSRETLAEPVKIRVARRRPTLDGALYASVH